MDDAVAVAHLLRDGLVTTQRHAISVSTSDDTRGRTSGIPLDYGADEVEVGMSIDRRPFVDMLIDAAACFP